MVDVYKADRPDYTPPGFYVGDFHFSSALPPALPGNGLNPLQPQAWLPMSDPMLSQTTAYDDNIYARAKHQSEDMVNTTTEAMNFETNWLPNLLTGGLYAAQQNYYVHPSEDADAYEADIAGIFEVVDNGKIGISGSFTRQPQLRGALEADSSVAFRPVYNEPAAIVSFTQEVGDFTGEIQYSLDKIAYNNAIEYQRNYLQQAISAYFAYHLSETTTLFLRPSYQIIAYNLSPDLADNNNLGITGGIRYVLTGALKFDLLFGLQEQKFRNHDFGDLYQPQINAYLLYDINADTSVEFSAANIVNPLVRFCGTAGAGVCAVSPGQLVGTGGLTISGGPNVYVASTAGITVQHEFYHDLLGELKLNFERDEFRGIRPNLVQDNYQLITNARFLVDRNVEIDLSYNYFRRTANFPNVNFYNSGPFNESILSLTFKAGL